MHLLAIDPGFATGVSLWRVPEDEPIERMAYWLIQNGPDGFDEFWTNGSGILDYIWDNLTVVCEKFIQDGRTPRVDPNALQIEGYLMGAWGINEVTWQRNGAKASIPDRFLRQHGFWLTGKQVGWKDADDVNDSQRHALHWAMNNHRPSQEFFWKKGK